MQISEKEVFMDRINLASDYEEGAHPEIIKKLAETNMLQSTGYGTDEFCESARNKIRKACECPEAAVHFLVGGTQANATVIDALLSSYQGVVSAESGHINVHEAGAIELGGHKVMAVPQHCGKIRASDVRKVCVSYANDPSREHTVMPGMVYISQPTEFGTLYSLKELTELSTVCREFGIPLYADGARLAYALASKENDVTLQDLARLCDVFYIGGTKCGALFGEAVVIPDPELIPHFFSIIKQHGALLAKGRILGIQFDVLFTKDLYLNIGKTAIESAELLKKTFREKGYKLAFENPTNQTFVTVENSVLEEISKYAGTDLWERPDPEHSTVRFATSWATDINKIAELSEILPVIRN